MITLSLMMKAPPCLVKYNQKTMTMTVRQLNNEDDNSIVDAESASMSKSCLMLRAPPCFVKYSSDQPYWETIDDDVKVQLVCDDSRGTNPRGDTYTNRHLTSEPMSPMFSVKKWSWPSRSPSCEPCHLKSEVKPTVCWNVYSPEMRITRLPLVQRSMEDVWQI